MKKMVKDTRFEIQLGILLIFKKKIEPSKSKSMDRTVTSKQPIQIVQS